MLPALRRSRLIVDFTIASAKRWLCGVCALLAAAAAPAQSPPQDAVLQIGHTAEIRALQYAPDGTYFATGAEDSKLKLWSPDGLLIRTIETGTWIVQLAISPDSKRILTVEQTGGVNLWSTANGRHVQRLPGVVARTDGAVTALAMAPNNEYAAIGTGRNILVYNLLDESITTIPMQESAWVASLLFHPDGRLIAGHGDGTLRIWNRDGTLAKSIPALTYRASALALSRDGTRVATAGVFGTREEERVRNASGQLFAKVFELNGTLLSQFPSHSTRSLHFSADGTHLISAGANDNRINTYTLDGKRTASFVVGSTAVQSPQTIALSPDGTRVVSADRGATVPGLKLWSLDGKLERTLTHSSGTPTAIAISPIGDVFASVSTDKNVRIWSLTGKLLATLPGHKEAPVAIAYAPNGAFFATGGEEVIIWSRAGIKLGGLSGFSKGGVSALRFSENGKHLLCAGRDGAVHVFDLATQKLQSIPVSPRALWMLAMDPSGKSFAAIEQGSLQIWNVDGTVRAQEKKRPHGMARLPFAMTFSRDGKQLLVASAASNNGLEVFDANLQSTGFLNTSHKGPYGGLSFSPSGKRLAISATDKVVVFDWETRSAERVLTGHNGPVSDVAFTPDERHLVTTSMDSTSRVWDLQSGRSMALYAQGRDWIMFDQQGRFDGSRYAGELVAVVQGIRAYGIDQFATALNRPDYMLEELGLGGSDLIEHLRHQHRRRVSMGGYTEHVQFGAAPPQVQLIAVKQTGKTATIDADISDAKYALKSYQVYVNDVPVFAGAGKPLSGSRAQLSEQLELGSGRNRVEISAVNAAGLESLRAQWSGFSHADTKSDLYFFGFGVSRYRDPALRLQYAAKDASDLGTAMQRYRASYGRVLVQTYTDEAVTPEAILKIKDSLRNASVDDTVVLLLSGHGTHDISHEPTFYYAPYAVDVNDLAGSAVSFDQIDALLREIKPRKKLLLIDACDSGEMDPLTLAQINEQRKAAGLQMRAPDSANRQQPDKPQHILLYDRDRFIYNNLNRQSGAVVLSATQAGQLSFESPAIQNGFFTAELIRALSSDEADSNSDGVISLDELQSFVRIKVALKTEGLQQPLIDRDNLYQRIEFPVLNSR